MRRPPSPPLTISPTCPPPLLAVVDVEVRNSQRKDERFEVSKGGKAAGKHGMSIKRKEESRATEKC